MAAKEVQTKLTLKGNKQYERGLKSAESTLDNLGGGAKGLNQALRSVGPAAGVAGAAIVAASAAMQALVAVGKEAIRVYVQLGNRGGAFSAVAQRFEQMADPALLGRLQELSGWHIQQRDLMQSFNRVISVGAVTQEQFEEIVERSTARAQEMGRNVGETFTQLTNAMAGRDIQAVASSLGISLDAVRDRVRDLGMSMESEAGVSEAWRIILEDLGREQGEVDNSAQNLGDAFEAMNTQFNDAIDNTARIVSESPAAVAAFEALREEIFGNENAAGSLGRMIAWLAQQTIMGVSMMVSRSAAVIRQFWMQLRDSLIGLQSRFGGVMDAILGQGTMNQWIEMVSMLEAGTERIVTAANNIAGAAATNPLVREATERRDRRRTRRPQRPEEGSGADIAEQARRAWEEAQQVLDAFDQQSKEFVSQQVEVMNQIAEQQQEDFTRRKELMEEEHDLRTELMQEQMDMETELKTIQRDRIDSAIQNTGRMASAVNGFFGNIIAAQEASGRSTEKTKRALGILQVAYSSVMAAVSLADSIRAFASQDYAAGAMHLVAMASYIAAAAEAGAKLGGGSGAAVAHPAATFTPAAPEAVGGTTQDSGATVINNNYSLGRTNQELGEAMTNSIDSFEIEAGRTFQSQAPAVRG